MENLGKTIKVIKTWKNNLKDSDENLKLKSFHLEQIIINFFEDNNELEIFDAIFDFFVRLSEIIDNPNVIAVDRADSSKFIDDYLIDFSEEQKQKIKCAIDGLLIRLEKCETTDDVKTVFEVDFYQRKVRNLYLIKVLKH